MIELTVKTLDSQNHQFAVEDGMTVAEFKIHIAEKVNIPAATQRIIYCGRVLQDNDKLSDYDVNGKVVHLVQRPPPSANQRNEQGNSSATDNTNHNRGAGGGGGGGFMGFDRVGNAVFSLGSMAFGNDPSHIPRRATHNLSASRLNVARRMLRGAEHAINHLENPNDPTNNEQSSSPPAEPNTEEEMTPIIEAQIVDATNSDQPMDENAVINAAVNSLFWDASNNMQVDGSPVVVNSTENAENPQASEPSSTTPDSSQDSSSTTPPNNPPASTSTPNSSERNTANGTGGRRALRTARGPEMAELLTTLNQLQARFAPFLARYQSFLQDDPQVAPENVESTGRMLRLVSHTMHYLSHAYHSLSDIMIDVEQPPPRLLVCRPILIQQSAMVHGGIPFQLEAQINIPAPADPSTNDASTTTNASARGTATPPSTTTANAAQGQPQILTIPAMIPNANINITQGPSTNMEFIGLPFVPVGGSMRVITTPIEIRTVRSNGSNPPRAAARAPNNNNNTAQARPSSAPPATDASATDNQQAQNEPQPQQTQTQTPPQPQVSVAGPFGSNSNMEFVVEVTPEMFRGAMNGPPPEFIQSLMQLVNNQLFNRPPQQQGGQQQRNGSTDATASQPSQNQAGVIGGSGQNSQARGNTQTNPTTATYTRSTARPHIQMTQQAVQGGFDPYLPCHSHHVVLHRHRVHQPATATTNASQEMGPPGQPRSSQARGGSNSGSQSTRETPTLQNLFGNLVNGTQGLDEIMAVSRAAENLVAMLTNQAPHARQQQQQPAGDSNNQQQQQSANNQNNSGRRRQSEPNLGVRFPHASLSTIFEGISDLNIGVTLDQLIPSFITEESDPPGTSLVTDFLMLLLRRLHLADLFLLNSGDLTPLQRNRADIQQFFLTTVCQNYTSPQGIESATERVMADMENIINGLGQVPAGDNIDLVRSVQALLRHYIPQVIKMAVNLESDDQIRPLIDRAWTAARQLLALVLHSAANGRQDVENVLVELLTNSMTDIPQDLRVWSAQQTRLALSRALTNLNVPSSDIEQFLVYRSEEAEENRENPHETEQRSSVREVQSLIQSANNSQVLTNGVEEMDLDSSQNSRQNVRLMEDTEPLPNVVYGSEAWHRQTSEDWVPIITRDVYKQRRQNSQPPFSDAYLSGMPSKRRKLINSSKPQSSLPQVIKESLRQAVTSTGVASSSSVESVVAAAGASTEILTAYRNMLHTTVQDNLKENEDFDPEEFPIASSYFGKSVD